MVMESFKSKDELEMLFGRIGYNLDAEAYDMIFQHASQGQDLCSINAYRNSLNAFILSEDLYERK